ncbi:flagellin N-terminal helical domain-containing protein [endosymbiont of Lamellibrachia barhami]|uniref:flagellin N-terminal helical domain-containing protein n=1 Tax=endosymbiont of Lamellibrachia barhami TaxID=205975 RepID=UPI0015AC487E|nr:flagellin [endosymbiont of Lamellibrachia barhami]
MAMVINTNVSSLNAQRNLTNTQNSLSTSMERLSSGLRINSAKDDAAGLGITDRMTTQIRGLNQAMRNANDAISISQTAEGAMQESTNILQRMRELAVQSANDSNSASDRSNMQKEVAQLSQELNRISSTTTFNGKNILDGTFTAAKFHVGANADQTISVSIGNTSATTMGAYKADGTATEDHIGGALTAVADGTGGNNVAADAAFAVTGSLGTSTLSTALDTTAAKIASQINGVQDSTGVKATASNTVELKATSTGTISFSLSSQDESQAAVGSAVSISALVTSSTDLAALRDAINAENASTGISATLNAAGDGISLTNTTGHDIVVADATNNDGADTASAVTVGGVALADSDSTGAGGVTDSIVVGGKVELSSSKSFQVSTTGTDIMVAAATSGTLSSIADIDIGSQTGANSALDVIDQALSFVSDQRADLGAVQNRLSSTISNLSNISENVSAARSRVQDADFAAETANMTRTQILQQAGVAMLSQANSQPQMVLSLLQ